jgi:hypothetical protein
MLPNLSSPRSDRTVQSTMSSRAMEHEVKKAASRPGIDTNNKVFLDDCDRARTAKLNQQREYSDFLRRQMQEHEAARQQEAQVRRETLNKTNEDRAALERQERERAIAHRRLQETLREQQAALTGLLEERQRRERQRELDSESKVLDASRQAEVAAERKAKAEFDLVVRRQEDLIATTRQMLQRKEAERSQERARNANPPDHFLVRHHEQERAAFVSFLKTHSERSAQPNTVPQMSLPKGERYPELAHLPSFEGDKKWRERHLQEVEAEQRQRKQENKAVWTADMAVMEQARQRRAEEKHREREELDKQVARKKEVSDRQRQEDLRWQRVYAQQLECQLRQKSKQEYDHLFDEHSLSRSARSLNRTL